MTAVQTHMDAIQSGYVTRTNIIGIRKILNANWRKSRGYSVSSTSAKINSGDVRLLERTLEAVKPIVRGELHETGLKLLRSKRYAKRLEDFAASIEALDHFRLLRFDMIGDRGQYAVPVYSVWSKIPPKGDALDGGTYAAFAFRNIPWQSGGNGPEIVQEQI